jgi:hypothetical protein
MDGFTSSTGYPAYCRQSGECDPTALVSSELPICRSLADSALSRCQAMLADSYVQYIGWNQTCG